MRRISVLVPALAIPALALTLAACGGGSTTSVAAASSSTAPTVSGNADFETFVKCLADHGITLPSGGPGGFDRDGDHQGPAQSGAPAPMASGSFDPNNPPTVGGDGHGAPAGVDPSAWAQAEKDCGDLGEMMRAQGGPGGHGPDGDGPDGDGPGDHDGGSISLPPVASASPSA